MWWSTGGGWRAGDSGDAPRIARHPGDVLRVALGTVAFVVALAIAHSHHVGRIERDVFRLVNDLPQALTGPIGVAMQMGSFAAVAVLAVAALLARRPRLARDLAVSGSAAWLMARAAKDVVGRGRPSSLVEYVIIRGAAPTGLGFPSGHVAVAAALATAAGPYLTRQGRRGVWFLVALVAMARVYVGAHLPVDVVGGAALGWVVGAVVHLLCGAPAPDVTTATVRAALVDAGLQPHSVTLAHVDARGSTPFLVETATGQELFVKVVGTAQRDADVLFKAWRYVALREVEDEAPFATPKQQVEHEAYLLLLARQVGARVPAVVTATTAGRDALLVESRLEGRALDAKDQSSVEQPFLVAAWEEVAKLRSARIAHRDLRLANVVDVDGEPWIIDFGFSQAAARTRQLAQDVAELLASLACLVGPERAVTSAISGLGRDAIAASIPLLQPLALSAATRRAVRSPRGLLRELRETAARHTGVEIPPPEPLARVRPKTVLVALGLAFAIHLLLPQVAEVRQTVDAIGSADWIWLAVGLVASAATYVCAGVAQLGAVRSPIALGPSVAVQLASSFVNRLTPANVGGAGLNVRFLERSGLERSEAIAAVTVNSAAGALIHVLGLVTMAAIVGGHGLGEVHMPRRWPVLVIVVAVLVVAGVLLSSRGRRQRLLTPVLRTAREVVDVVRQPGKALQVFGGSAGVTAGYILALSAALTAFGAHVGLAEVALVYLGGSALGAVSPTPGGLGVVEATLVTGLTAVGVEAGPAIAGVLGFRLLTFWLPILPAWLVFRALRRRAVV